MGSREEESEGSSFTPMLGVLKKMRRRKSSQMQTARSARNASCEKDKEPSTDPGAKVSKKSDRKSRSKKQNVFRKYVPHGFKSKSRPGTQRDRVDKERSDERPDTEKTAQAEGGSNRRQPASPNPEKLPKSNTPNRKKSKNSDRLVRDEYKNVTEEAPESYTEFEKIAAIPRPAQTKFRKKRKGHRKKGSVNAATTRSTDQTTENEPSMEGEHTNDTEQDSDGQEKTAALGVKQLSKFRTIAVLTYDPVETITSLKIIVQILYD
ncbi:hypothetical protein Q1695_011488 [Nippostrongylus brasiliensis]|nr:hypothetical protein Q1695_011488 [Nippostrongylus brasiliensis]